MPALSTAHTGPPRFINGTETATIDLTVVIVNYNVREFLEQALRSLERACGGLAVEVFVVDNNSVDGSVDMVTARFPDVHVIANRENVGFGRANNQAIRRARGRYLLILNPDTIVQEDTLQTFVRFMDAHPEAGAAGCKILNPDGTFAPESRRSFPTPAVALYRMLGLSRLFPRSQVFGRYNLSYLPVDETTEVDALSGSCMMVRHAALYFRPDEAPLPDPHEPSFPPQAPRNGAEDGTGHGAGLFDEAFFMYGEDLDWCYRIQQAGWRIYYTPDTQIIHYKGESTKKGELRYVRHFYGAMLQFTEKHFRSRHTHLFSAVLRLGILGRASLQIGTQFLRRLSAPLLEGMLVLAVVLAIGVVRFAQAEGPLAPLFYGVVAPGYALATVLSISVMGGYRRSRRTRLRPVLAGAFLALVGVATLSFFVKAIAFSRLVVAASFVLSVFLLCTWRLVLGARLNSRRHAVLVADAHEAQRLHEALADLRRPPFTLIGYIATDEAPSGDAPADLPRLGTLHHLRDVVRLRRATDVVYAARCLPNHTIFRLIQLLRDLPVEFRILAEGREHVIGRASIDDLTAPPLLEAEDAIGRERSTTARRAFDASVALIGLLAHPLCLILAWTGPNGAYFRALLRFTRQMPAVLRGQRALVGYHPHPDFRPPPEWPLRPGVFSITDTLDPSRLDAQGLHRAYWFYVRNQSAGLDGAILRRTLRRLSAQSNAPSRSVDP